MFTFTETTFGKDKMENKPPFYRRAILFAVDSWRVIMDARYSPLRFIPDPSLQAYFTLVLFTMWSVFFGFIATYYLGFLGYDIVTSIFVHLAVIIPLSITNGVFIDAERNGSKWAVQWREEQSSWKLWKTIIKQNFEKRVKWDIDKEA